MNSAATKETTDKKVTTMGVCVKRVKSMSLSTLWM